MEYKPNYPIIILYARDWNVYRESVYDVKKLEETDFVVARGWIIGWLIKESKDKYIIAFSNFDEPEAEYARDIIVIPKETILYKQIFKLEDVFFEDKPSFKVKKVKVK